MKRLRRWLRRNRGLRHASRPTVLGFAKAGAVFTLAFALFAAPAVAYYQEPGINGVASRLAGKKVSVQCADADAMANDVMFAAYGVEGYVEGWIDPLTGRWRPKPVAYFKGQHCDNLLAAASGDLSGLTVHAFAWSLLVLVHESGHLKGAKWSGDEALTQCWAMQHARAGLNLLGFREDIQWRLVLTELLHIHKFELPPQYYRANCQLPSLN